jgi:hypothetical protein
VIAKKLMKAKIKKEFVILVEVKDSCESSATATVSIETQNMVISKKFQFSVHVFVRVFFFFFLIILDPGNRPEEFWPHVKRFYNCSVLELLPFQLRTKQVHCIAFYSRISRYAAVHF